MKEPVTALVRVRFAPSPTGLLHVGGLRTALYNYLFARRHGGQFILRIEDTDRERYVEGAEEDIRESLRWAGLTWEEGPEAGGEYGPYYQSERRDLYQEYVEKLIAEGNAYYAFDTPEELEAMREEGKAYDATTRGAMVNALTLSEEEVEQRLDAGEPYVVRMKVPTGETVRFKDDIRGHVSFETDGIDDQVLLKSDGMPTYHLANVVDDHIMRITHVIRGEEWLPSTPKHLLLYRFFGWEMPKMAHLPLILSPEGGKLSKRDATELGIPISVRDHREAGFEPEALINFLAFLGWNPGTEQELFSLTELVEAFELERVGSSGVQFNMDKLRWFNEQHIKRLSGEELARRTQPYLKKHGLEADDGYLAEVAELMKERVTKVEEIVTEARYFFAEPETYDEKGVKKRWKDDAADLLTEYADLLEESQAFSEEDAESILRELADDEDVGAGRIIHPTRLALSGVTFGPSLFAMMEVLGRETCIRRMRRAVDELGSQ